MTIKLFTFNPFQENTYIIYDETNQAVIIDAGCLNDGEKRLLKNYFDENKLILSRLINTHLHLDHQHRHMDNMACNDKLLRPARKCIQPRSTASRNKARSRTPCA